MAAVAIAKPRKKQRTDRVEPYDDTASEASIPSTAQKTSRPNSGKYTLPSPGKFVDLVIEVVAYVSNIIYQSIVHKGGWLNFIRIDTDWFFIVSCSMLHFRVAMV